MTIRMLSEVLDLIHAGEGRRMYLGSKASLLTVRRKANGSSSSSSSDNTSSSKFS